MLPTSKRVILVDDDQDDAEIFADALKELYANVKFDHFSEGTRALAQLKQKDIPYPDIIFLDINMPVLDGWDCLREIKSIAYLANIPIIMYSTSNLEDIGLNPADVGATAFLTKPNTFREVKAKLGELLNRLFGSAL